MEHRVSVGFLLQSYFNVSWESKLLLFQFVVPIAEVTAKSLGWAQGSAWHQSQSGECHQGMLSFGFSAHCQLEKE